MLMTLSCAEFMKKEAFSEEVNQEKRQEQEERQDSGSWLKVVEHWNNEYPHVREKQGFD